MQGEPHLTSGQRGTPPEVNQQIWEMAAWGQSLLPLNTSQRDDSEYSGDIQATI